MKKNIPLVLALPLLSALAVSCGREVKPPAAQFGQVQQAYNTALERESASDASGAEPYYLSAAAGAEALLKSLASGDEILGKVQAIRDDSFAAVARIRDARRRQAVGGSDLPRALGSDNKFATKTPGGAPYLNPPVVAFKAPEGPKPPTPPAPTPENPNPTAPPTPTPTAPGPGEAPKPPAETPDKPKEPEKPKEIQITKAVLKDGKVALIYWTFKNISADKRLTFGAPAGKILNKGGATVGSIRHTYRVDTFKLNVDEPAASEGTPLVPDAFSLAPGESRALVTVGGLSEAAARQFSGVTIELRMNDGDLSDQCTDVVQE